MSSEQPDQTAPPADGASGSGSSERSGRTAQQEYTALVRDVISPALRELGWVGGSGRYQLPSDTHIALLSLQKSRYSDRAEIRVTANLAVTSRRDWDRARAEDPSRPLTPTANACWGPPVDSTRIGHLLAEPRDTWWSVCASGAASATTPSERNLAVGQAIIAAARDHATPWLQARMHG